MCKNVIQKYSEYAEITVFTYCTFKLISFGEPEPIRDVGNLSMGQLNVASLDHQQDLRNTSWLQLLPFNECTQLINTKT